MIVLESVHFAYSNGNNVLHDLGFSFREGDRIGIIGANGSGKTTLLHTIVGLLRPDAGRVILFGREMKSEPDFRAARRKIGFVFQDADDQLFCPTVAEDIAFGPRNLGKSADEAHEIVHRTLDLLGIEHLEKRVTYRLSGGEKKLVALATVLAMEPEVLILDEPVSGLSEALTETILGILEEHAPSLIVVSHDEHFLKRAVKDTLTLKKGHLHQPR